MRDSTKRRKYLVCGGDTRSFLAVVRSLGRSGGEVQAAYAPTLSPALHSKYLTRLHNLPPYQPERREWLTALERLLEQEKFDLVVPCTDNALLPLRAARERLSKHAQLLLADEAVYDVLSDKIATVQLAEKLGIGQPLSRVVTAPGQLSQAVKELGLPVVVKPRHSVSAIDPHSKQHVWLARSERELNEGLLGVSAEQPALLQSFVMGRGVGVEVLAQSGEVLFAFQHERVHEPLRGGGSTYRRGVAVEPSLLEATKKLVKAVNLTGVAMYEFRIDRDSGAQYFFEVNARFWGSLPLAVASGADFPRFAAEMILEGRREFPAEYQYGLYSRNLILDLRWCFDNLLADHNDRFLLTEPRGQTLLEWLNIFKGVERSDTFVLDDPLPGFVEICGYVAKLLAKVGRWGTLQVLSLPWIRHRTLARARKAFRDATSIVFICKGNICRSPFAALYAAAKFPKKIISGGGLRAQLGNQPPAFAVECARVHGINLAEYRARGIDREIVLANDLLIVFEAKQRAELISRYPEAAGRVLLVAEFLDGRPGDVADPFGGPREGFQVCYAQLATVIDRLILET